jgi:hypothetical protein
MRPTAWTSPSGRTARLRFLRSIRVDSDEPSHLYQDVSSDTANFARNDRESRRSLHRQTAWWQLVWPLSAGRMTISSVTQRRSGGRGRSGAKSR